ncbi:hypothetical protein EG329_012761 [Mollisiaceae sp. DMI_Dod_QoI]|nr:hypothetical protein EG329_012761 [Helotiales sp. DMI_Dod_QoI]
MNLFFIVFMLLQPLIAVNVELSSGSKIETLDSATSTTTFTLAQSTTFVTLASRTHALTVSQMTAPYRYTTVPSFSPPRTLDTTQRLSTRGLEKTGHLEKKSIMPQLAKRINRTAAIVGGVLGGIIGSVLLCVPETIADTIKHTDSAKDTIHLREGYNTSKKHQSHNFANSTMASFSTERNLLQYDTGEVTKRQIITSVWWTCEVMFIFFVIWAFSRRYGAHPPDDQVPNTQHLDVDLEKLSLDSDQDSQRDLD